MCKGVQILLNQLEEKLMPRVVKLQTFISWHLIVAYRLSLDKKPSYLYQHAIEKMRPKLNHSLVIRIT